ncbi:MAG: phosphoglycerate mutase [Candidatus Methanomethylophilus sp.]|nr:phosphoglycerate mutase [Methanomethylophilus sp.]
MQNTLFVLLDGLEDDPNPALGGKKPYEVAKMPFLHRIAPHQMWTTGRGYTQLFLNEFFTGHPPATARAALEAQGLGMDLSRGRMAFRLSPAFIDGKTVRWAYGVDDRVSDITDCINSNLYLLDDHAPQIKFFVHGRAVITMDCPSDPPQTPAPPQDAPYVPVPGALGDLILKVAEDLDGLTVYPWGCGRMGEVFPPFPCIKNMTAVSDSPTALGVAATLGHKIHLVPELDDRFPIARRALRDGHVFLHMDEVDEYSHERDYRKKIAVLEHIDELMSEYFDDVPNVMYFVDHGTSCVTGQHLVVDTPFWTSKPVFKDGEHVVLRNVVPKYLEGSA